LFKKLKLPKNTIIIILCSIIGFICFSMIFFSAQRALTKREHEAANVLFFSKGEDDSLLNSLNIDSDTIHLTIITKENIDKKLNEFLLRSVDVIIIDRFMPEKMDDLRAIINHINGRNGRIGLIFFGALNNDKTKEDDFSDAQISAISEILPCQLGINYKVSTDNASQTEYKTQVTLNREIENQKLNDKPNSNVLVKDIEWMSCPLIGKRMMLKTKSSATQIIEAIEGEYSILSEWHIEGGGTVILYSMVIHGYNDPFVLWPYFNYLMYISIFHAKADFLDSDIESFTDWPYSPIPHAFEMILWFSMIGILWIITFFLYFKMRNKSIPKEIPQQKIKC